MYARNLKVVDYFQSAGMHPRLASRRCIVAIDLDIDFPMRATKKLPVIDVIPNGSVTSMSQELRSRGISSYAAPNKKGGFNAGVA